MRGDTAVEYESGHRCTENGVGDLTLVCPTQGEWSSFIPIMLGGAYLMDRRCPLCGVIVGPVTVDRRFT